MSDLINILSIIDDKSQLINFPKLDPNSFKPAVLTLIQRLKDTVKAVKSSDREPTWDTLVTPIEDASENLSYVWSVVEHLNRQGEDGRYQSRRGRTFSEVLGKSS